jgi:tellurite methyltransferase
VSGERLDTAHEAWDQSWGDAGQRVLWEQPDPVVTDYIAVLRARGAMRILDVGGGIGRHALAYARAGFEVTMIDASPAGVAELLRVAGSAGVQVDAQVSPFTALPVEDSSIDHVLAWNVLYHGDRSVVTSGLRECFRVLRPGGTAQLTMLSKRNDGYGVGREIRPDTFIDEASGDDKAHPHYYADAAGVCSLLAECGFEVRELVDVVQHPPRGWHWTILADAN